MFLTWRVVRKDIIGRRPVVIFGLVGIAVTTIAFGWSTSLVTILASRFLGRFFRLLVIVVQDLIHNEYSRWIGGGKHCRPSLDISRDYR